MVETSPVTEDSSSPRPRPATNSGLVDGAAWQRWWRIAVIGGSALAGALGLLALARLLAHPLLLLFAAIVIAEALAPVVAGIARRLPRTLAVVLVYLVLVLGLAAFGWLVVPRLAGQAQQLVVAAPALVDRAQAFIAGWDPASSEQLRGAVLGQLGQFGGVLISLPVTLVGAALEIGVVFLMSVYWLLATPALHRFVHSLLPERRRPGADRVLAEIRETAGGYALGKGLSVLIVGVVSSLGLTVIGVEFPLVLALIAGVGELIPIVGIYVATIPAVAVALVESPTQALLVLGFYVVLQQVQSNLLMPAILRSQAGIPPLLAIFALVAGERLAGILGALVAIPLAGVLQVLVVRVVAPAVRGWTGAPAPER